MQQLAEPGDGQHLPSGLAVPHRVQTPHHLNTLAVAHAEAGLTPALLLRHNAALAFRMIRIDLPADRATLAAKSHTAANVATSSSLSTIEMPVRLSTYAASGSSSSGKQTRLSGPDIAP